MDAEGGDLKLYSASDGSLLKTYDGLPGPVFDAVFSPDGERIAASGNRTIQLWDAETGQRVLRLRGHKSFVYALAWSPDGTQIASGGGFYEGKDCSVRLWGRLP